LTRVSDRTDSCCRRCLFGSLRAACCGASCWSCWGPARIACMGGGDRRGGTRLCSLPAGLRTFRCPIGLVLSTGQRIELQASALLTCTVLPPLLLSIYVAAGIVHVHIVCRGCYRSAGNGDTEPQRDRRRRSHARGVQSVMWCDVLHARMGLRIHRGRSGVGPGSWDTAAPHKDRRKTCASQVRDARREPTPPPPTMAHNLPYTRTLHRRLRCPEPTSCQGPCSPGQPAAKRMCCARPRRMRVNQWRTRHLQLLGTICTATHVQHAQARLDDGVARASRRRSRVSLMASAARLRAPQDAAATHTDAAAADAGAADGPAEQVSCEVRVGGACSAHASQFQ
jgi:hypothetical protein